MSTKTNYDKSEKVLRIGSVSGSYITIENCLKIGNVEGLKFIDEFGVIRIAKKFEFSNAGTPYLHWGEYEAGCLIPCINLRMNKKLKWC
jgi:hypothetical protein